MALIPVATGSRGGALRLRWLLAKPSKFRDDPLLGSVFSRLIDLSLQRSAVESDLDTLIRYAGVRTARPPRGFVFQVSRCGSTLLCSLLGAIPGSVALREPEVPATLLWHWANSPENAELYGDAFRASILALGRLARAGCPYFVKFSSGCIHSVGDVRSVFPNVREVFLYRDPLEVIVSNLKQPYQGWIWEEKLTGVPAAQASECCVAELIARAIGRKLAAMAEAYRPDQTLLLNYSEIDHSLPARLAHFFGITLTDEVEAGMRQRLSIDAKHAAGRKPFVPDGHAKRRAASSRIRQLCQRFAEPQYEMLEAIRRRPEPAAAGTQAHPG